MIFYLPNLGTGSRRCPPTTLTSAIVEENILLKEIIFVTSSFVTKEITFVTSSFVTDFCLKVLKNTF